MLGLDSRESTRPDIALMLLFMLSNLFMNCMNCCCIEVMFACITSIDVVRLGVALEVFEVLDPFVEILPPVVVDNFDATDEVALFSLDFDFGAVAIVDAPSDKVVGCNDAAEVLRTNGPGTRKVGTESDSPCWYCAGGSKASSPMLAVSTTTFSTVANLKWSLSFNASSADSASREVTPPSFADQSHRIDLLTASGVKKR